MALLRRRTMLAGATVTAAFWPRKPATAPAAAEEELGPLSAIVAIDPPGPPLAIILQDLAGSPIPLASFRGRPVVLNFWATWCAPCVRELPELDALAASQSAGGIVVLAVSADRGGAAVVRPFLASHHITHATVLLDHGNDAVHALRTIGFPTTFVLDAEGRLRAKLEGPTAWSRAEEIIQKLTERK